MARAVLIWKRSSNHIDQKENQDMAHTLTGNAAETELTDAQRAVLRDAIKAFKPHADHPTMGGLLGKLQGADGDDDGQALEKALFGLRDTRADLRKAEGLDPMQRLSAEQTLIKSERALEHELMLKNDTGGYRASQANRAAEEARTVANLGRAA